MFPKRSRIEYEPSDPPTLEDWKWVEGRARRSARRGRIGIGLGIAALVAALLASVFFVSAYFNQRDVSSAVHKVDRAVEILQANDKASRISRCKTLTLQGDNFATAPFPDLLRVDAVNGLYKAGRAALTTATASDDLPSNCDLEHGHLKVVSAPGG